MPDIIGYVLAGGQSSRFGSDKARALYAGQPLLLHAVASLQQVAADIRIVADRPGKYADLLGDHHRAVVDAHPGLGPLSGLLAALHDLPDGAVAVLSPCDMVGMPPAWLAELVEAMQPEVVAAAYRQPDVTQKCGGWEPLHSAWRKSALPMVQAAMQTSRRSPADLLDSLGALAVSVATPSDWHRRIARIDTQAALLAAHSVRAVAVTRRNPQAAAPATDSVAIEQPLEIRLRFGPLADRNETTLAVTLRTPGNDAALIAGLLMAEGIVRARTDLLGIAPAPQHQAGQVWVAELAEHVALPEAALGRKLAATAACGLCGKGALDALTPSFVRPRRQVPTLPWSMLCALPDELRQWQPAFAATGGVHGAAVFDAHGQLLIAAEDIGRHNAVDKALGQLWLSDTLPSAAILVLSGRAGFELVQKAAIAGVPVVVAIGATSTLAVETAKQFDMTLVGFVRGGAGTVYAGGHRIG